MALPESLTIEEFLRWESQQTLGKNEYFLGRIRPLIVAMPGGADRHNTIEANLVIALGPLAKAIGLSTYTSNQMVMNEAWGEAFYPDASIFAGPMLKRKHGTLDAATNPVAVFEVASPSTVKYDRAHKLDSYRAIPTIRAVVLIDSEKPRVEAFLRHGDEWRYEATVGLGATAGFLGIALPLDEIYDDVKFLAEEA